MNILIRKQKNAFIADLNDLPGSPPVGWGGTPEQAVASLFLALISDFETWGKYIDKSKVTLTYENTR